MTLQEYFDRYHFFILTPDIMLSLGMYKFALSINL
ncbi:hypothetical protein SAMN05444682_11731 [Parapedobacter indicus]|uniref:Uncharacterized protein n=1 Tax=Parapedobacter indicus TaxID=1477437 RepID=A0A1I3VIK3_9SPHI|nr:hypothetical protein CLV26_11717 [Parapedobacter indicus]SFJ95244.1 hypothetical protein SAMN05444682_11731 [Parapedobacter indicus]